jgi:hypothetical protein
MRLLTCCILLSGLTVLSAPVPEPKQLDTDSPWDKDPSDWNVAIYPIYAWVPVFGAHTSFPDAGGGSNGGPGILDGSVSGSFSGAFFSAVDITKSHVVAHTEFMYASVSGDNSHPTVHIGMKAVYGSLMGGFQADNGLSLEGGFRRLALDINAAVNDRPGVSAKPGIWDPLIGVSWTHQLGRQWMLKAHVDGGGFGVGSDVDVGASVRADWRFARHFGVTLGAEGLHLQLSSNILEQTSRSRTLKFRQTLYGPMFGFGIYF